MGGMQQGGDDDAIAGINVTPFVDISLVLLIVFMVTAKYIVSTTIPVDLPEAATGNAGMPVLVSCSIDASQQMYLDTVPMTPAEIRASLVRRFQNSPDVRVVINADRTVPHGKVVELIDIVRSAGIDKFAFQTQAPTAAAEH